jgi:hypothetical protein
VHAASYWLPVQAVWTSAVVAVSCRVLHCFVLVVREWGLLVRDGALLGILALFVVGIFAHVPNLYGVARLLGQSFPSLLVFLCITCCCWL